MSRSQPFNFSSLMPNVASLVPQSITSAVFAANGSFAGGGSSGSVRADVRSMQEANQQGLMLFKITGEKAFLAADEFYTTTFTTLNGSGVTGEAIIGYDRDSNTLTVAISASGLEANQVHIQHIHGFLDGVTNATTPTNAQDDDGDGFVELAEGLDTYGPVLLNLSTNHDNAGGTDNGHSHGAISGFPTAPNGKIYFVESYQLPAEGLGTDPKLDLREIVIHGLSVPAGPGTNTPGEIDGTPGYKLVLPVASGEIVQITTAAALASFIGTTNFDTDAAAFVSVRPGDTPGPGSLPPGNGGQPGNGGSANQGPNDTYRFDISRDGAVSQNLGSGQDTVEIKARGNVDQIRLTFTSSEVGNGVATDSNTMSGQDGGLAVRVQAEGRSGALTGEVSRFDDEGITFTTRGNTTFDVRDLVSGAARGDQFDVVTLGTSGNDVFDESGERDAYYINGGMGNDTITGGVRNDFLVGGAGNDTLNGREGDDSFIGGGGADLFVFTGTPGNDRILDFVSGTDKIDLSAYDLEMADISTSTSGTNTIISVDSDGNGSADFQITLMNAAAPSSSDYVF